MLKLEKRTRVVRNIGIGIVIDKDSSNSLYPKDHSKCSTCEAQVVPLPIIPVRERVSLYNLVPNILASPPKSIHLIWSISAQPSFAVDNPDISNNALHGDNKQVNIESGLEICSL